MKIFGSNREDTLIGTASGDTIKALGGNDLIATAGGIDAIYGGSGNDMITGFSATVKNTSGTDTGSDPDVDIGGRSRSNKSIFVDGGDGSHDIMLIEVKLGKGESDVSTSRDFFTIKNIEEFIYNISSVSAGQKVLGSNSSKTIETIVIGAGNANVEARGGNDMIYTADGDDTIKAGSGSDFIHAGNGHNTVTGGTSTDYFHFHLTGSEQYTEITDFESGIDKVLITIDVAQYNFLFETDYESPYPDRSYGDRYLGVGPDLNAYVSYNNGRAFDPDPDAFASHPPALSFDDWAFYEESTGSIFIRYYQEDPYDEQYVLVAHVTPGTEIDDSDFSFRII
jgi:hypothetical protein